MPTLFAATLFVSAALLFAVQPLVGKLLLPLLGGVPAVWTACMAFFQAALLAGYLYAHALASRLSPRRQATVHALVLAGPLLVLTLLAWQTGSPVAVSRQFLPPGQAFPVPGLLLTLLVTVGLPFFVVSTSAPLLQRWFANTDHPTARDPYFLYAASNAGSLLALAAYPTVFERFLGLSEQGWCWAAGYLVLAGLILACARAAARHPARPAFNRPVIVMRPKSETSPPPPAYQRLRWLALAAVPSSLMLGVTTYLSTDVASFPLLWVVPLGLYLLTFIVAFAYLPPGLLLFLRLFTPIQILLLVFVLTSHTSLPLAGSVFFHLSVFGMAALACHAELARSRPGPERLTAFYLWVSLGGVLGGLFNAVAAPLLFDDVYEYPVALVGAALLLPAAARRPRGRRDYLFDGLVPLGIGTLTAGLVLSGTRLTEWAHRHADWLPLRPGAMITLLTFGVPALLCYLSSIDRPVRFGLSVAALFLAGALGTDRDRLRFQARDFFGVLRVEDIPATNDADAYLGGRPYRQLVNGTTLHGIQILDPNDQMLPLTYYHRDGPIGQLFAAFAGPAAKRRVGVIGLGTGTLAAYAESPGQEFTFFEIDPTVERVARTYFTFLEHSPARCRVVLGDARVRLEQQAEEPFGLLFIDAFSSDAIPVHLLTREALLLYLDRLEPDGVLAIHISNRHLDLEPLVGRLARDAGLVSRIRHDNPVGKDEHKVFDRSGRTPSEWVVVARHLADLGPLAADRRWEELGRRDDVRAWTDQSSNVFDVLNWRSKLIEAAP